MLDYFVEYIKKWNKIGGKMDRHSYWSGLLTILIFLSISLWFGSKFPVFNILAALFAIAMIIPWITATVRRLHDVGRATWFILLILLPLVGWICIFVELIQCSQREGNIKKNKKTKQKKMPMLGTRI